MRFSAHEVLKLSVVAAAVSMSVQALANEQTSDNQQGVNNNSVETVTVYGEKGKTKSATKLNLSIFETPQTVTVISRDQMDDFALRDVNSLLKYAPGVTVEKVETDRTYYTARGFDIVNFQYDGVGVPFTYGLTQGHVDTALYEQIEVVKGATGLTTGLANPSATINYVRKLPTADTQAYVAASMGSWNKYRLESDISGSIIDDKVKGRLVIAKQDGDSYLDRYAQELSVFYGVLNGDITDNTRYVVGHSVNNNRNDSFMFGALPLFYSDGSQTHYDRSTSTAPDWAYQDVKQKRTFAELEHDINDNWTAKGIFTRNVQDKEWESFYLAGSPDPLTEDGLLGHASQYFAKETENVMDLFITGTFSAWGQEHEVVAGINLADLDITGHSVYSSEWNYHPVGPDWAEGKTARPNFDIYDEATQSTNIEQEQNSFYVSTRLNATDNFSVLLGARTVDIDQTGISYGPSQQASANETVPYIGATYEVIPSTMLYGSFSEVFKAQTWVDEGLNPLGPVKGISHEFGVKQTLYGGNAILTLARFGSKQENFGEWVARDTTSGLNIYRGADYTSKGYELELTGEIAQGLNISAGIIKVDIENESGEKARTFIPTKQFKLATAYQVPQVSGLRVGGGINWQNEIYYSDIEVQENYALVDFFVTYELTDHLTFSLNVNNIADEKYLESPQWGQANYGPGRNVLGTVAWRY